MDVRQSTLLVRDSVFGANGGHGIRLTDGRFVVYQATPRIEPALAPQAEKSAADILGYGEDGSALRK